MVDDDSNDLGLNMKEMKIVRQERKKRIINHMLCQTFLTVNDRALNNEGEKNWCRRLLQTSPENFEFRDDNTLPFITVRDRYINFPSFERNLYCSLDYDMLILIICVINLIDQQLNNPVVAICLSYLIERVFRLLRRWLGERNLVRTTFVDKNFLL